MNVVTITAVAHAVSIMNIALKEKHTHKNKQWNETDKTVQSLKVKRGSTNEAQTEGKLEMKHLGTWTGTSEKNITNRLIY